jgi:hypothetical protein
MTKINPNSSIRSGYSFEDIQVFKHCVNWLIDPKIFKEIRIQYTPEELTIRHFAIDDITVTRTDGIKEYYQLKHLQNPDRDLWDFKLLKSKGLKSWIKSFLLLIEYGPVYGALVTNGKISIDLSGLITERKFAQHRIAKEFPDDWQTLTEQFSAGELEVFFNEFEFKFEEPGIAELEASLREVMYKQLKVTKAGVDSLLLYISSQGREKYPKIFTLDEIRACLSWDNPRPLDQNFEIPQDFEFFDRAFHETLLKELNDPKGGIKVFTGKPGSGKSTYLSKLYSILKKNGVMTFRHHYHLNPKDSSYTERLNNDRVKEALKAEFKKQKNNVIKELGEINTEHIQIREFIDRIAEYHRERQSTFILIIDGLDHVIREGKSRGALVEFLNDILYPQQGYWLIFGTQEMATPCFPKIVEDYAPRGSWIQIPGLQRGQVAQIARKIFKEVSKSHKTYFRECTDRLFELSEGNPLHLRYLLNELTTSNGHFSTYDLDRLKPYNGDISNYYSALWKTLPCLAQSLCYAITALDFRLQQEQLFSLASCLTRYPAEVSEAFRDIKHLIRTELSGIAVYHNSFQVFMNNQPELKEQQTALYFTLREWLKLPAQEELRWSEAAKVEYYLGNPEPLLAYDNNWIINSFLECRDQHQIVKLLDLATKAAFEFDRPDKVIYFSTVSFYFENRAYNLSETLSELWSTSFQSQTNLKISYPDFSTLSHYQVKEILIALKNKGMIDEIPEEAKERIDDLYRLNNFEEHDNITNDWIEILHAFPSNGLKSIFSFLKQFRKPGTSASFYTVYTRFLINHASPQIGQIQELLKLKLTAEEREGIFSVLKKSDMITGVYFWRDTISRSRRNSDPGQSYYGIFSGLQQPAPSVLPGFNAFPDEETYQGSDKSAEMIKLYQNTFDTAYFNTLAGADHTVKKFLAKPSEHWTVQLAKITVLIATEIAGKFSGDKRIQLDDILSNFRDLAELDFSHDFKIYEIRRSVIPSVIDKVVWLIQVTNKRNGYEPGLDKEELDYLFHHPWYYQHRIFELIKSKMALVSEKALTHFKDQELGRLGAEISPFNDKAKRILELALLYKNFEEGLHLKGLLEQSARNILSYGHHKDITLHNILQGLDILIKSGSTQAGNYIRQVFPYVYHIEKLTDGDETGTFISEYYLLLAQYDTKLLRNFYFHRLQTREYLDSELLWGSVVKTLDLNDPIAKAVAYTAIDFSGHTSLQDRIQEQPAQQVLSKITAKFGDIDHSREEREPSPRAPRTTKVYPVYKIIPGTLQEEYQKLEAKGEHAPVDIWYFLNRWAEYWLKKQATNPEPLLQEIIQVLGDEPWGFGTQILPIIFPYALKVDKKLAFDCLCWQMIAVSGWAGGYMTADEDAQDVWSLVLKHFPESLDHFYTWTVSHSGCRHSDELRYAHPMPKSILFFTDTGQTEKAEKHMEYHLDTLAGLFPNVDLEVPDFWNEPAEIEPMDILLKRFEWMSPLVRSMAGEQTAALLQEDHSGKIHHSFYTWLKSIEFESMACQGLLLILKSLRKNDSRTYYHLDQQKLGSLLRIRCMATDLLMNRIADLLGVKLAPSLPLYTHLSLQKPTMDLEHFKRIIDRNVTLSYLDFLEQLEEKASFSVWRAWLSMFRDRCNTLGLKYERDDIEFENRGQSVIVGRSTIFAEIVKSTFFNILDYMYHEGKLPYGLFYHMTLKNLPVDPSVWSVQPVLQPKWWPTWTMPTLKSGDEYPELPNLNPSYGPDQQQHTILSCQMVYCDAENFYHAKSFAVQRRRAFAYHKGKPPKIKSDQLFSILEHDSFLYPEIDAPQNFGLLDNELGYMDRNRGQMHSQLVSLSLQVDIGTHHIWEHYRLSNPLRLLHPLLSIDMNLEILESGIGYFSHSKCIAEAGDFMTGYQDTKNPRLRVDPHQNYLMIDTTFLKQKLEQNGLSIAYLLKEEFYIKDKPYKDEWPKPHVRYRIEWD